MNKMRIAVFFGGVSSEHEVSCVSAATVLAGLAEAGYETVPVGITKEGAWFYYPGPLAGLQDGSWPRYEGCRHCILSPDRRDHGLFMQNGGGFELVKIDAAFPVLHGKNGEDGTIQGLFELAGIPYVGCGVLASAVCMDKAVANALLDAAGVPRCEWDWALKSECADFDALEARLCQKLHYPMFVKPANAGSSVGISRAEDRAGLKAAIATALHEDGKVVFERFVQGQEVECAAIGNTGSAEGVSATRPGEILAGDVFYTYDDKYKNGVSRTLIPANLSGEKLEEVRLLAEKAYQVLGCEGLARCDFFVEAGTGRVLLNEVNTLPGFTAISMYPKLMEAAGVSLAQLCRQLVQLALAKAEARHG